MISLTNLCVYALLKVGREVLLLDLNLALVLMKPCIYICWQSHCLSESSSGSVKMHFTGPCENVYLVEGDSDVLELCFPFHHPSC